MKKIVHLITFLVGTLLATTISAQEIDYTVKKGDTLSEIVAALTQGPPRLYGPDGRVMQVASFNNISNPDLIYPGQRILIPAGLKLKQRKPASPIVTVTPQPQAPVAKRGWRMGINIGGNQDNLTLTSTFGNSDASVSAIGVTNIYATMLYKEYTWGASLSHYIFDATSDQGSKEETMLGGELFGIYKHFLAGIYFDSSALMRSVSSKIELYRLTTTNLQLGYTYNWQLPTKRPLLLDLNAKISIPLTAGTSASNINIDTISGLSFVAQLKLSYKYKKFHQYQLYITLPTYLKYHDYTTDLSWGGTAGTIKSEQTEMGAALGLEATF